MEIRCPEEAGRFETSINVLIISLKSTETEINVQETGRERLGKWKCERGPREAGCTLLRWWIAVLVPPMVSTMARWDAATSLQLGSSGTSPCNGATSMTKCPLSYKSSSFASFT